ncbi:MAG TPA: response regulator [Gemmatimonadota bacterium]|nr:response regulator [Gemmatimonadota bacterium]
MTDPAEMPGPGAADHQARILIVDDEPHNRSLLEVMLTPEGFQFETANSGEGALACVARQPPDLILLDVMMPDMDGYEVAARLKGDSATNHIPIIMVTALGDREAILRGLNAGAEDFLSKPVDRAGLRVRVRNLLRLKAYSDYYSSFSQTLQKKVASRTTDLVERTRMLEQQAAVLTQHAALLDMAPNAIIVRDLEYRILFWNRGAELMYGWPRAEALGRVTYELLKTEFPEPIDSLSRALLLTGQWDGEVVHQTRDGRRLLVASRWGLQIGPEGTSSRVLTIHHDITEQSRADAEHRLLSQRLSLATAVAKVGVWEWDLASDGLTWDATMFEIYGLPPVVPMAYDKWTAMVVPEDLAHVEATLQSAIDRKGEGSAEFRIIRPDGDVRNITVAERAVLDDQGKVSRLIGVNMDVTERKDAEEALAQSRRNQLQFKDDFLSHVSHELRSPLTAIKQFTSILLGGLAGELNTAQREYQEIVLKNVDQLQSMIDDLLEVTRLETGKLTVEPERVSISDAITDTIDTLKGPARGKGVSLSWDVPSDLPAAYADRTRLRQILIILLDNAIKFTQDGGSARIRARQTDQDPPGLVVEVSDTGCGISPEIAENIFGRLYQVSDGTQSSRKGLGLGLFICKELVTRQGGEIWVSSQLEKGSTFSFTLPTFSLTSVIAPLLKNDKWPAESVALLTVDMKVPSSSSLDATREELSTEARSVVHRCLLPDLDVLLPAMDADTEGERFLIAAFADEKGAAGLADRLREQFKRLASLEERRVNISVSFSMLPPLPWKEGVSTELMVASMATHLEESVKHQEPREPIHHE